MIFRPCVLPQCLFGWCRFPLFKDAQYEEAVLGPGDMLYIPSKHWHYVRSLSPSFSVNFWF